MGLFSEVGRQVEQLKQAVASDTDGGYRCTACDAGSPADHDHCPKCGEAAVEPVGGDRE